MLHSDLKRLSILKNGKITISFLMASHLYSVLEIRIQEQQLKRDKWEILIN